MSYEENVWEQEWKLEKASRADLISHAMQWEATRFSYRKTGIFIPSFRMMNPVSKINFPGLKLLDLGCGSGAQASFFASNGFDVTAIDIEQESINKTIKTTDDLNLRVQTKRMNAEDLKFKDYTFDVTYINCMLMHTNAEKVINEAWRVLKPGGILIIKEVKKEWLFSFPYRTVSPYRKTNPKYLNWSYIKELEQRGFHHKEFYLTASLFNGLFFLYPDVGYALMRFFQRIDDAIFYLVPITKKYSWVSVLWKKK